MSASTSTAPNLSNDRTQRFDQNGSTEEVLTWILEYACKYGLKEVVNGISAGNPRKLLLYGITEGRLVAYLLWNCVSENVVEGYDLCIQLLRHTYTHAPLICFQHYAQILFSLKVKVMLHILADKFELCLASSKLKELFPKEGEKLPPALEHDATLKKELTQLNRRSSQFRQLALDLILDRERREMYLQSEMEEEYGAEFSLTLNDLVAKFVQTVEDYLPIPVIEEISSSEQYLSPPDGCSPAVSSLLAVLEVTNGNPSTADLITLVHELETVRKTRTRKQNCLPGSSRYQAKLTSTFKSPQTKEKTNKTDRSSPMIPQGDCVEDSAKQQSTSTGSSGSQFSQTTECSGITHTTLSDSSDVEIVEVSSEPNSECSPGGKKATRLQKETDTRNVKRVKTSLRNKSSVCTRAKGLDAGNSTTKGKELKKVKAKSPLSWNLWENTLRNDLIGSKSRGNKKITDFKSFSVDNEDMKVTMEDSDDETQCSKESSSGRNSVNDDKVGAEERPVLRSDQDHISSPLVITLDSSIDSDTSITSPLLLASLEEQSLWKMKRQREEEQLSTEHSRKKRRKLDFQEKSSSDNQVPVADLQETSKVDKVQLEEKSCQNQERESTTEEVANQSSCSGKPATGDKVNRPEDEDTNAEGQPSSQVSISLSAEGHSIEVPQEMPKESTSPCSVVGSKGGTQPFSPILQEAAQHEDNSTTIADHTDASTTLHAHTKDEDSLTHKGGAKALMEEARPSHHTERLSPARSATSNNSIKIQDSPMTTVERAPLANTDDHISAKPHHRKAREDSAVQWAEIVHQAIQSAPTGAANLADICQYISENFPRHGSLEVVAQSVCRVLSAHKCFQVISSPQEIKWTLNAACDHKLSLPGLSLAAKDREPSPEDSDVTSSTPDGVDSASKVPVSNPSGDDRQSSVTAEEEEKNTSPASETTSTTMEADTAVHENDTPESRADDCSDNTVSSSQDEALAVHHVVSSGSSGSSSCHTLSMIPEEVRQQNEGSDAMFPSTPYFGDCTGYKNPQVCKGAIQSSSRNQVEEMCRQSFAEQAHEKSKRKRSHSEHSGTEKGSHSQSSDESIIPPSPQEEPRSDLVTFARTRRALAVPHTCGKEVDSMLEGGEDAIVSDSDSDSESTVLYYEQNDEDSDTESYVIPNSHDKDDSFNSLTGPKAPVMGASMRSALWTKDHTLVPSLSQHLSSCPVRPCVVLLHRLTADDLKPCQPQKP